MTRHKDDYYRTPDWCADDGARLARHWSPRRGPVLDPCAGDGALLRACERFGMLTSGIELDPERAWAAECGAGDALGPGSWPRADVVLMNPPFKLWQEFIARALSEYDGDVPIVVLLRLAALAGQKRRDWWLGIKRERGLSVHVLSKRPSFTGGATDSADYAWIVIGTGVSEIDWI